MTPGVWVSLMGTKNTSIRQNKNKILAVLCHAVEECIRAEDELGEHLDSGPESFEAHLKFKFTGTTRQIQTRPTMDFKDTPTPQDPVVLIEDDQPGGWDANGSPV